MAMCTHEHVYLESSLCVLKLKENTMGSPFPYAQSTHIPLHVSLKQPLGFIMQVSYPWAL